jgi:hypothetical protein
MSRVRVTEPLKAHRVDSTVTFPGGVPLLLNNRRALPSRHCGAKTLCRPLRHRSGWTLACVAIAFLTCSAQTGRQTPTSSPDKPAAIPETHQQISDAKAEKPSAQSVRTDREKQIAKDNAELLKLAIELKSEIDKTSIDTLSLSVIRKADEIEKLARSLKGEMKLTVVPAK